MFLVAAVVGDVVAAVVGDVVTVDAFVITVVVSPFVAVLGFIILVVELSPLFVLLITGVIAILKGMLPTGI